MKGNTIVLEVPCSIMSYILPINVIELLLNSRFHYYEREKGLNTVWYYMIISADLKH